MTASWLSKHLVAIFSPDVSAQLLKEKEFIKQQFTGGPGETDRNVYNQLLPLIYMPDQPNIR